MILFLHLSYLKELKEISEFNMDNYNEAYGFSYVKSFIELSFDEDHICQTSDLKSLLNYHSIYYTEKKLKDIYSQYQYLLFCKKLFPTVFVSSYVDSSIQYSLFNKFRLNSLNFPNKINSDKVFQLGSFCFSPLIFHLQLMDFMKAEYAECFKEEIKVHQLSDFYRLCISQFKYNDITKIKETPVSYYLKKELGDEFSYGRLVDFADNIYDLYKHTEISVKSFRRIFYSFAQNMDTIGGDAYEYYMKTRNSTESWKKAIGKFLVSEYFFSTELGSLISYNLIS